MGSPLPAVTDRRKIKTPLHSMVKVSVFRDCGEDTDHRLFSGCGHPSIYCQRLAWFAYSWAVHYLVKDLVHLEKNWRGRTEKVPGSGSRILRSKSKSSLRKCIPNTFPEPWTDVVDVTSGTKLSINFWPESVAPLWDNVNTWIYRWCFVIMMMMMMMMILMVNSKDG